MNIKKQKKAISPVVATALLIVVAVVAVVGFQGWFGTFSSKIFTNTQTQSDTSVGSTQIETVIGNSVYFDNGGTENITITSVKVEGIDCNIITNATSGMSELDISNCLANVTTTTPEVVIYTDSGIYSEEFYLKTPVSASNSTTLSVFTGTMVWNQTYSGHYLAGSNEAYARGVKVDGSGNVYVVGNTVDGVTLTNYYTVKYDSSGNELWSVMYDDGNNNEAYAIDLDASNNVYVTGYSNNNYYTIKYDTDGNELWNSVSINAAAYGIAVDSSRDVLYVTGVKNSDFFTIKYNSTNGNQIWNKTMDNGAADIAYGVDIDTSGNIYVTGDSDDGLTHNYFTIKYNGVTGNAIWNKTYDGGLYDEALAIVLDSSNNVYVTGDTDTGVSEDFFTIKYDSNGNELWNSTYDVGSNSDIAYSIAIDSNDDVYVGGKMLNATYSDLDYLIVKYDGTNGNLLLNFTVNGGSDDEVYGLAVDSSDNLYVTGYAYDPRPSLKDFYTLKYDSSQNLLWDKRFNIFTSYETYDNPYGIAVDSSNNVYVTGYVSDGTNTDIYVIKYDSLGNILLNFTDSFYLGEMAPYDLVVDSSGNIYVTGSAYVDATNKDFYTAKYDLSGNKLWNVTYNESLQDTAWKLVLDSNNDVYVLGYVSLATTDITLIKYNGVNGNLIWSRSYDSGDADNPGGIGVDSSDNIYISEYKSFNGYYLLKYDLNGNSLYNNTYNLGGGIFFYPYDLVVDSNDKIYLTGNSMNNFYTVKYDSNGNEIWNVTYNAGGGESSYAIDVDSLGEFIYVTGNNNNDYVTIQYNTTNANQTWIDIFDFNGGTDYGQDIVIDYNNKLYVTGVVDYPMTSNFMTIKYS